jgi:MOSC domain-containing protein YiiM
MRVITTIRGRDEHTSGRYIAQQRDNTMGIYCDVIAAGTVRVGDALTLLSEAGI